MQFIIHSRPVVGIFAALLCLASFKLTSESTPFWFLPGTYFGLFSFLACCAAMLRNDAVDWQRDVLKGKSFGMLNRQRLFYYSQTIFVWCGIMLGPVFLLNRYWGLIAIIMIALAIYYEKSYTKPFLTTILVALCSALPAMFALLIAQPSYKANASLFLIAFAAIFAREILKDIEDMPSDTGYKSTVPLGLGMRKARILAASTMLFSASLIGSSQSFGYLRWLILPAFLAALLIWPLNKSTAICKTSIDFCTATLLIGLLI